MKMQIDTSSHLFQGAVRIAPWLTVQTADVDGPHLSGWKQTFDLIACYQMSSLFAQTKSAGRDGVR